MASFHNWGTFSGPGAWRIVRRRKSTSSPRLIVNIPSPLGD